jgi:hypothetical protein
MADFEGILARHSQSPYVRLHSQSPQSPYVREKYAIFVSGKLYKQAKEHVRESGDKFKKGFPRSKNASDNSSEGPK